MQSLPPLYLTSLFLPMQLSDILSLIGFVCEAVLYGDYI